MHEFRIVWDSFSLFFSTSSILCNRQNKRKIVWCFNATLISSESGPNKKWLIFIFFNQCNSNCRECEFASERNKKGSNEISADGKIAWQLQKSFSGSRQFYPRRESNQFIIIKVTSLTCSNVCSCSCVRARRREWMWKRRN